MTIEKFINIMTIENFLKNSRQSLIILNAKKFLFGSHNFIF